MRTIHNIRNVRREVLRSYCFSVVVRNYNSLNRNSFLADEVKKEISRKLGPVSKEFSEHRALEHPLFTYLKNQSSEGFTDRQFLIYRDNFLWRTELTVPSIAEALISSIRSRDFDSAMLFLRNLVDEMGGLDVNMLHPQLLFESHNMHGVRVFNIDPLVKMLDVKKSELLVPEVKEYRDAKEMVFTMPYPYLAGNTWAHELAADSMLDHFKEAFFDPYQGYYTAEEYGKLTKFFTVHKDPTVENGNTEQKHEEMAMKTVEAVCYEALSHIKEVKEGGLMFLDHQARLWDGMLRELEKARGIGEIIKPKPGVFIEEIDDSKEEKPEPKVEKATAKKTKEPKESEIQK